MGRNPKTPRPQALHRPLERAESVRPGLVAAAAQHRVCGWAGDGRLCRPRELLDRTEPGEGRGVLRSAERETGRHRVRATESRATPSCRAFQVVRACLGCRSQESSFSCITFQSPTREHRAAHRKAVRSGTTDSASLRARRLSARGVRHEVSCRSSRGGPTPTQVAGRGRPKRVLTVLWQLCVLVGRADDIPRGKQGEWPFGIDHCGIVRFHGRGHVGGRRPPLHQRPCAGVAQVAQTLGESLRRLIFTLLRAMNDPVRRGSCKCVRQHQSRRLAVVCCRPALVSARGRP